MEPRFKKTREQGLIRVGISYRQPPEVRKTDIIRTIQRQEHQFPLIKTLMQE